MVANPIKILRYSVSQFSVKDIMENSEEAMMLTGFVQTGILEKVWKSAN